MPNNQTTDPRDAEITRLRAELAEARKPDLRTVMGFEAGRADAAAEIERLRKIETAARDYYRHYAVDEAESPDLCVCGEQQHQLARALREALGL